MCSSGMLLGWDQWELQISLGCRSSYWDNWAMEPTGIAGVLLGKAQGCRSAQFNNWNKQCLHS